MNLNMDVIIFVYAPVIYVVMMQVAAKGDGAGYVQHINMPRDCIPHEYG